MGGVKRRGDGADHHVKKKSKKAKYDTPAKIEKAKRGIKSKNHYFGPPKKSLPKKKDEEVKKIEEVKKAEEVEEPEDDSDSAESAAAEEDEDVDMSTGSESEEEEEEEEPAKEDYAKPSSKTENGVNDTSKSSASRESHAKQKALAQERKAAKPNADSIGRTKKLWERLRRKSHVPKEERKKLVAELYDIITGKVKDFVFKHDSVRVIQTALKYATSAQRKQIAEELKGEYRSLAESKYAKFLIGKMLVHGDSEIRDMIVPEFYGHVKRLMRHPEASWIVDDIYRTVATSAQRNMLLREWYGPEFVIFRNAETPKETADLATILERNPEKRGPIMQYLHEFINLLVQKKATGFTMLHDAMLQYFLNTKPGSTEATEFTELLKGDEEGDLVKNLAFTVSGARLMCLALAYSNAKDRKLLLRMYRDTIKLLAGDANGHLVLLAAYEVIDDTKLSGKSIFPELLSEGSSEAERNETLLQQINDLVARVPILYVFAGEKVKWLIPDSDQAILDEIRGIRAETSKKDPNIRRQELIKAASPTLLRFLADSAELLVETSFGCQFISEVLFSAEGDKSAALAAVAATAQSKPEAMRTPAAGRMLKSLVQGGRYNTQEKTVEKVQPPLDFHNLLYQNIKDDVMSWATESNPFVIVALTEADDFEKREELIKTLKKNKKVLTEMSDAGSNKDAKDKKSKKGEAKGGPAKSAAKLLLEKI